ncbi:MAG: hypothetical protein ABI687_00585, partial [Flavitalea sp.]
TDTVGNWIRRGDFDGVGRSEAVAVVLDTKVYAGLGFDGTSRLTDFWEYDVATDAWRRKKDFPGIARNAAVAFSAGGKVYVYPSTGGVPAASETRNEAAFVNDLLNRYSDRRKLFNEKEPLIYTIE